VPRPIHFEIPADDPARAITFYETVFGWKFQKWEGGHTPYWLISTGEGPGINGGLLPRRDPAQPAANTIDVENLDTTLAVIDQQGGKCVLPKMAIPGVGWLAYCKDMDGNMFGIMQNDPAAK
jgi:predicted enzyme related to lactoylglutathione lyase